MKYFFYLLGILLISIGLLYVVSALNLFVIGYNFFDFIHFMIRKIYFWFLIIGLFLIIVTLWIGG